MKEQGHILKFAFVFIVPKPKLVQENRKVLTEFSGVSHAHVATVHLDYVIPVWESMMGKKFSFFM